MSRLYLNYYILRCVFDSNEGNVKFEIKQNTVKEVLLACKYNYYDLYEDIKIPHRVKLLQDNYFNCYPDFKNKM